MTPPAPSPGQVIDFWRDAGHARWFGRDAAFDAEIRARFKGAHLAAARAEYAGWEATSDGALALLILLDQFPRNLYRGSAHAFATDPAAREIARRAVERGFDQEVEPALRAFVYLPFEHSERPEDQARAVALFEALGDADYLRYARVHADVIARFGRFPHRNAALGRLTTPEEARFLDEGGFRG